MILKSFKETVKVYFLFRDKFQKSCFVSTLDIDSKNTPPFEILAVSQWDLCGIMFSIEKYIILCYNVYHTGFT